MQLKRLKRKFAKLWGVGLSIFTVAVASVVTPVNAQSVPDVKVGLLVPLTGAWARTGEVMRMGAEMGVERVNKEGGIKALGGAKLKLVVLDAGDSIEKAKNAAQRMVAQEPDLVAGTGSFLSSFTLAVTEVTERAHLPWLTLSFSDLITSRGFKYVFQTSATAGQQAERALPVILDVAEKATGTKPKTVAIVTDNTASSLSSVKPMRERLLKELGIKLLVDETFTPPLSDATPLIQKVRTARPDILLFLPTTVSDTKLVLEKLNEFGLGQGKLPVMSFGTAIGEPDLLKTLSPDLLQGVMSVAGGWGAKGQEDLMAEIKRKYNEPWLTHNAIATYADMWLIKEALERAGKADREAVAETLRTMDGGPTTLYAGGRLKFDANGRRVGATLAIFQWQSGVPVTVYPPELAVATPIWPKNK